MPPDEYTQALDKALSDLKEKVLKRDLLTAEIAGLKETVRVLSSRVELSDARKMEVAQLVALVDSATPKLTDAIRSLLTSLYPEAITAVEARNELERSSTYDDTNISLSACHAALKRMFSEGEVEYGPVKDGKSTYRRVLKIEQPLSSLTALRLLLDPRTTRPNDKPRKTIGQMIAEEGGTTPRKQLEAERASEAFKQAHDAKLAREAKTKTAAEQIKDLRGISDKHRK